MVDLIRLFGSATVTGSSGPARLPAGVGEIVALLAIDYRQVAERRTLALRLRESADADAALNALRQTLLRLRRLEARMGVTVLHAFDGHLARTDACVPTDLEAFLALGEVHTAEDLRRLLDLYRGDLLADVDASGDLRTWLDTQRTRLRDRFIALATDGARRVGGAVGRSALERVRDEIGAEAAVAMPHPDDITHPARGQGVDVPRIAIALPPPRLGQRWRVRAEAFLVETTIAMQRTRLLEVVAPHSMLAIARRADLGSELRADFVVYPQVRSADGGLDLSLVETASGVVLATHRVELDGYTVDGGKTPLGAIIARRICDAVSVRVQAHQPVSASRALYTLYLSARRRLQLLDLRQVRRARIDLRQIVGAAPEFAPAWSLLAHATTQEWSLLGRLETEALRTAERHAMRAIEIDPSDPQAHRELGRTSRFLRGIDESLTHFSTAQALAPNDADLTADHADTRCHASDLVEARRLLDHALRLNPIAPDEYRWTDGALRFFQDDYSGALAQFQAMRDPEPAARLAAAAAAMAGERDIAAQFRNIVLANCPDFTVSGWMKVMPQRGRRHAEIYSEALRRAGFPQ